MLLLLLAYLGFVSLGLPDALLGVAWPSLRHTFAQPQSGLGAVLVGMGAGFFLSSSLAGRLMHSWGVGTLLAISTGLVMLALFGYALAPGWGFLIACAFLVGLGSGAIDAGLNAYAAGHFSARDMNWLHASYSLGTVFGPLIMTAVLAAQHSWRWGYAIVALVMVLMTALFGATRASWQADTPASKPHEGAGSTLAALRHPLVWLHVATFFVYTGVEFTAGQWCFAVLREGRGLSLGTAGLWTSIYWASLFAGRVLLGFVAERVGPDRLVRLGALGALTGALVFAAAPAAVSPAGLALLGFSLAPIYPMLMLRTPDRLGRQLSFHSIGFQVSAAMVGSVVFPTIGGALADRFGLEATASLIVAGAGALFVLQEALFRRSRRALPLQAR